MSTSYVPNGFDQFIIINKEDIDLNSTITAKFYGFKEGDVDNSCNNCDPSEDCGEGEEENSNRVYNIIIDEIKENGDNIVVDFVADDKDSIYILGVTVLVEPLGIELDTLITYDSDESMPEYNYNQETGLLKVIWQNENAYNNTISTTNNIFKLKFKKGNNNTALGRNL